MSVRAVACPQCGKSVAWDTANRWRPFCSQRCRLIDLGAWASESYRIPVAGTKHDPPADQPDSENEI